MLKKINLKKNNKGIKILNKGVKLENIVKEYSCCQKTQRMRDEITRT